MSVFDDADKYIRVDDIPTKYRRETRHLIGLFHGPVDRALTDVGYAVSNRTITTKLFDGHDIVLLGDIHKHQVLRPDGIIVSEEELGSFDIGETGMPELSSDDKQPFQQKTFTLHDEQAEDVDAAVAKAKEMGHGESAVNENSNGNALAFICQSFNRANP